MYKDSPVESYPGYKEAKAKGQFTTPQTADINGLMELLKKATNGLFGHASQQPVLANPYVSSQNVAQTTYHTPTPTTQPNEGSITPSQIQSGFSKFASDTPMATQSALIAQALGKLSPNIDPKLILALALKESRGGKDLIGRKQGLNNPYNVMPGGKLANYPDLETALLGGKNPLEGGVESQGLIKLLNSPIYKKYQESGNPADFFEKYSPAGAGNAPLDTQVEQARKLMEYFK